MEDQEFYIVEAIQLESGKPIKDQTLEYNTYAECDNWDTARQIELKDGPHGRKDIFKSRILGPFPLQTKELV